VCEVLKKKYDMLSADNISSDMLFIKILLLDYIMFSDYMLSDSIMLFDTVMLSYNLLSDNMMLYNIWILLYCKWCKK
jgi:hypothetical protein